MNIQSVSCEHSCSCKELSFDTRLVLLTGGPGAGKTAVLEFVRKIFCEHVAILPEAASILFSGGFWRLNSISSQKAAQRAIYHVQDEMQKLVLGEKKWSMGLCDRGTLDGLAYWPGDTLDFCKDLNTNKDREFKRYQAVIHLESPSTEMGYNFQNPMRIESAEAAYRIDQKIHEVWKDHPNYCLVKSTTAFMDKVNAATNQIQLHLPLSCSEHLRENRT